VVAQELPKQAPVASPRYSSATCARSLHLIVMTVYEALSSSLVGRASSGASACLVGGEPSTADAACLRRIREALAKEDIEAVRDVFVERVSRGLPEAPMNNHDLRALQRRVWQLARAELKRAVSDGDAASIEEALRIAAIADSGRLRHGGGVQATLEYRAASKQRTQTHAERRLEVPAVAGVLPCGRGPGFPQDSVCIHRHEQGDHHGHAPLARGMLSDSLPQVPQAHEVRDPRVDKLVDISLELVRTVGELTRRIEALESSRLTVV